MPPASQAPSVAGRLHRIEALTAIADKAKADGDAAVLAADAAKLAAQKLAAEAFRSTVGIRLAEWTKGRAAAQLIDAERVLLTTDSPSDEADGRGTPK